MISYNDAVDLFLSEGLSRSLAHNTIIYYQARLRKTDVLLGVKAKNIRNINTADLRVVLENTSTRSKPNVYRVFKTFFNFLIREELIEKNPMLLVKCPKVQPKVTRPLTMEQVQHVLTVAKKDRGFAGVRDHAVIATLVGTGIRRGELSSLLEENVDLETGQAKVDGKTGARFIPLPPQLCHILRRYRMELKNSKSFRRNNSGYFFRAWNGGQLSPNAIHQIVKTVSAFAGVHLHSHVFRHSYATHVASFDNLDVLSLQALMGWSSPAMCKVYIKTSMPKLTRIQDRCSPLASIK